MPAGADCRAARNVVVTPLILSKSLSVKIATFISGHLGDPDCRALDEVEQQRAIETLFEDEMTERACERHRHQRQADDAGEHEGVTTPVKWRLRKPRHAIDVEAARQT